MNYLARQAGRQVCGQDILSLSVGAAYYPVDGSDTERLLAEADKRMYAAKLRHHQRASNGAGLVHDVERKALGKDKSQPRNQISGCHVEIVDVEKSDSRQRGFYRGLT
jgi:GGDEF domain-containing protein